MNKIKPDKQKLGEIYERYNNKIFYRYFIKQVINPYLDSYLIPEIQGKELLYIFYLFNEGGNGYLKKHIANKVFSYTNSQLGRTIEDLFNAIGLSYIENTKEDTYKVIIPKYISNELKEIDLKSFPYDLAKQLILSKYRLMNEKCEEFTSIFVYSEDNFFKDKKDYKLQLIDGYSSGDNYLDIIFKQIGNLDSNRLVLFRKDNYYAVDGLVLKHSDNKLIINLIKVKLGDDIDKIKIFEQIRELEKDISSFKQAILKCLSKKTEINPIEDQIEVNYIIISKKELKDERKASIINFKWIKHEVKKI